jgi:PPOX class probable F420-dependent enzyme
MAQMTREDALAFLAAEPARTGKLALVRSDGAPIVVPIWFALDGDDLLFTTHAETAKGRILRRDPRLALCVDDERPPYAFVTVHGTATLSEDPAALLAWATAIGGRYMGADRAEEFGTRNGVPGELLVHVRIERMRGESGVAD